MFPTLYPSPGPRTRGYGLLHRHHMHIDPPLSQWNSESFESGRARSLVFPTLSPSPGPHTRGSGVSRRHHIHIDPPLSQWNSESFVSGRARSFVFPTLSPSPGPQAPHRVVSWGGICHAHGSALDVCFFLRCPCLMAWSHLALLCRVQNLHLQLLVCQKL